MRKVLFILSELADSDVDWMVDNGTKKHCARGAVLIEEGKPIEELFLLLDGHLSVTIAGGGGQEVPRLGSGEILGELSFLDSRPPAATVTAFEEATVLGIPRTRLTEKLREDTGFAARFYRALGVFLGREPVIEKHRQAIRLALGEIGDHAGLPGAGLRRRGIPLRKPNLGFQILVPEFQ